MAIVSEKELLAKIESLTNPNSGNSLDAWYRSRCFSSSEKEWLVNASRGQSVCLIFIDVLKDLDILVDSLNSIREFNKVAPLLSYKMLSQEGLNVKPDWLEPSVVVNYEKGELVDSISDLLSKDIASEWIVFVRSPAIVLKPGFLHFLSDLANAPANMFAAFGDDLIGSEDDIINGLFRPNLNIDMLLTSPEDMSRHWFFRSDYLRESLGADDNFGEVFEFDVALRLIEEQGLSAIGKVDQPLFLLSSHRERKALDLFAESVEKHLRRRGYIHPVIEIMNNSNTLKLVYGHIDQPLVSIIIYAKDRIHALQTCVESILEKTVYPNYELLIVDDHSETPEAIAWLSGLQDMALPNIRVLRFTENLSYPEINNRVASEAQGDYILILEFDIGMIHPEWLDELMNHAQRPEVGVVGAKILSSGGGVQHTGIVMGMGGAAESLSFDAALHDLGYMNRLVVDQDYSAVTSACMLVKKSVFEKVGGLGVGALDPRYNDVDFCLRVASAGFLTVWTPHSVVMRLGNESPVASDIPADREKVARIRQGRELMYERWLPYMAGDPAFNRNLSLRSSGFEVDSRSELNWQPQKFLGLPTILAYPADQWGCGHYRIMQPLESMRMQAFGGGMVAKEWLTVPEMARLDPDALVYQRQITAEAVENMKEARCFLKKPVVYELDDYLPNLPIKSAYRKNMPKDILKSLRRSLKHVDRFVVSTHPLAEAFKGIHSDIRVVENRLPLQWWEELAPKRRQSEKPRVGWAGGIGHTGDLELVEALVRDLADEVEWVFLGMCPDMLRPFVKEVHDGVNIELYPQKLASMNLDLAIAPLEDNLFNRCKSNLRLLEYGICGFPVVCSDVEPYREHDLPVTRVKNRYKDWLEGIRMHLSDLDETARQGDELRKIVRRDWMLEGDNLHQWLNAWTRF